MSELFKLKQFVFDKCNSGICFIEASDYIFSIYSPSLEKLGILTPVAFRKEINQKRKQPPLFIYRHKEKSFSLEDIPPDTNLFEFQLRLLNEESYI